MDSYSNEPELSQLELSDTEKVDVLPIELFIQSERPPAGDPRIAAFSKAMIYEMRDDVTRQFIKDIFQHRDDIVPSYAANLLLRGFQKHLLRDQEAYDYPQAFDDPEPWQRAIRDVLDDPEKAEELTLDLYIRNVQSNIAERYKSFKLIMGAMKGRLGDKPSVLDIGCSQNQGLKKLALDLPFGEVEVVRKPTEDPAAERDPVMTHLINQELSKPFRIGGSIGVDIMPMNDPRVQEWAKSCSFYPSELLDEKLVEEYDLIDKHEIVSGVGFEMVDFTDEALHRIPRDKFKGSFDVVTLSTVMYQLREDERMRMADIVRRFLKPDGLVIYQDFAEVSPDDPTELEYHKHWFLKKYSYTTAVLDTSDPKEELQEIFRWENGRCQRLVMGAGSLCINGTLKTYPELLPTLQEPEDGNS